MMWYRTVFTVYGNVKAKLFKTIHAIVIHNSMKCLYARMFQKVQPVAYYTNSL